MHKYLVTATFDNIY